VSERKSDPQPAAGDLISESVVRRVSEDRRADAELVLITNLLKDVPELRVDPGARVSDYIDGLVKRRAELLKRDRPASASRTPASQSIDRVVTAVGQFFSPWTGIYLPDFANSNVDDAPGVPGTFGDFKTDWLFPGGVEFEADPDLRDLGIVQPDTPKWWGHSWIGSYVFPVQPSQDGWLYYRFTPATSFAVNIWAAQAGAIILYTNVSTISDAATGSLFGPAATLTVDWPYSTTLPTGSPCIDVQVTDTQVSGSIQVQAGQTPAIGFIYGISTGLATGLLENLSGTLSTGLVEYRFETDWWVGAVGQRLNEAANPPAASS